MIKNSMAVGALMGKEVSMGHVGAPITMTLHVTLGKSFLQVFSSQWQGFAHSPLMDGEVESWRP